MQFQDSKHYPITLLGITSSSGASNSSFSRDGKNKNPTQRIFLLLGALLRTTSFP
nr:hypothetical protein GZ9C4_23 [uncultured archaeon GZfos9C4]